MKNKKTIMTVSAILILMFHLWMPFTPFMKPSAEGFIIKTAFIGVDMFFFVSAFSIGKRGVEKYFKFVGSRFKSVYVKYVAFALFSVLLASFTSLKQLAGIPDWKTFFESITFVSLFKNGGGSFLWFLPAILLMYITLPLFDRASKKQPVLTGVLTIVCWAVIGFVVTKFTKYNAMFIFFNRIPIMLCGYYAAKYSLLDKLRKNKVIYAAVTVVLLAGGYFLLYKFGYRPQLNVPIYNMFYITAIPAIAGLILFLDIIPDFIVTKTVGNATLEIYALQMILGTEVVMFIYKKTKNLWATNLGMLAVFIIASVVLNMIINLPSTLKKKKQAKEIK